MYPHRSRSSGKTRAPLKRAAYKAVAKRLGITLGPIGAPVPHVVKKLAAIDLQRRQVRAAIPALARLGAESFLRAQADDCNPTVKASLIRQSQDAWRLSRLLRRCSASLITSYEPAEQRLTVRHTESCKFKLCPHCARSKAMARHRELTAAVRTIKAAEPDAKFILITLTKPKSTSATLAESLDRLSINTRRLLLTPMLKRIVRGYFAVIEVNYADGLFHDHCHVLVHVLSNDYGPDHPHWLPQRTLVHLWSKLYATDQKLVADIRFVRVSDDDELRKTLAELGKYLTSPLSLFKSDPDQPMLWACHAGPMLALAAATYRRRLMTCGGSLAAARRSLKCEESHDPDIPAVEGRP